jgi:hypothetical protein
MSLRRVQRVMQGLDRNPFSEYTMSWKQFDFTGIREGFREVVGTLVLAFPDQLDNKVISSTHRNLFALISITSTLRMKSRLCNPYQIAVDLFGLTPTQDFPEIWQDVYLHPTFALSFQHRPITKIRADSDRCQPRVSAAQPARGGFCQTHLRPAHRS